MNTQRVLLPLVNLYPYKAARMAYKLRHTEPACYKYRAWMLALSLCLLAAGCGNHASLPDEVRTLTLKTLSGEQIALADVNSPILINFWATDCAICIREMPDMATLYQKNEPAGFKLVAVAMPYDPPNLVLAMAEREQWPFPVALDVTGEVLESFATVKGTPTSYLLDKDGQLVKRYVGAIPIHKLQKQLNSLLEL